MVLVAAVLLIVVVVFATVLTVGSDVARRPGGERLVAFKDWQALIGAVLGFMGAAGVLVLGTAIEADQERQRVLGREHAIGLALAYEAERLSNGIAADLGIVNLIRAQPPGQDFVRTCTNFVETLKETLDKEKPVWTSALGQMIEFGDNNLQLFVRYHGLYDDIVHDVRLFKPLFCEVDGENQINEFARRLEFTFDYYRDIAKIYGTALVEPAPAQTAAPGDQTVAPAEPQATGT